MLTHCSAFSFTFSAVQDCCDGYPVPCDGCSDFSCCCIPSVVFQNKRGRIPWRGPDCRERSPRGCLRPAGFHPLRWQTPWKIDLTEKKDQDDSGEPLTRIIEKPPVNSAVI
ncbi:hypothetical protein D4T05_27035 [Salmonella enterica]|nr:hypothetical protein [Salmonella enterica]EAB6033270.1 hypothetical protein [Salmonella enterica subsp. enterica serovar Java]ECJ4483918.1 hypothetical protein [Salmonella enterica subsp. diarizonae]ECT8549809.1 hypothetical protein [Salmonella enterica subsp. diarizonae serovar 48:i:z]EAP0945808.1 hypothetical protein [Salmonella enterica]